MQNTKIVVVACAVALALGAAAADSASGATAGWMVGGSLLSGSKQLAPTASVQSSLRLNVAGITIECRTNTFKGNAAEIISPNVMKAHGIEFTECNGTKGECSLGSETVTTVPVLIEVTLEGVLATIARLKPQTKTTIATASFIGEKCALLGVQNITGSVLVLSLTAQDERSTQQSTSITTEVSGELKVGASVASVTTTATTSLASGQTWSFL